MNKSMLVNATPMRSNMKALNKSIAQRSTRAQSQYSPQTPQYSPQTPQYTTQTPQYTPQTPQQTPFTTQQTPQTHQYSPVSPIRSSQLQNSQYQNQMNVSPARVLFKSGYDYQQLNKALWRQNQELVQEFGQLQEQLAQEGEFREIYNEQKRMDDSIRLFDAQCTQLDYQNMVLKNQIDYLQQLG